jgi:4-hydroxy-3-polyprenylbenzoate decarboxylase
LIEIRNMEQLTLAGAIIAPANPGFYMLPNSIEELVDFMAGRVLDLLKIPHPLNTRWVDSPANARANRDKPSV